MAEQRRETKLSETPLAAHDRTKTEGRRGHFEDFSNSTAKTKRGEGKRALTVVVRGVLTEVEMRPVTACEGGVRTA